MSKTNWISTYSDNKQVQKFQAGGPMGQEAAAPQEGAPQGGAQGPDLEGMIQEYAQTRDPQLAVAICDTLVEMMAQQGGGAPQGGAPAGPEAGAPMARKGMRMSRAPRF
jgi:hypothetical protein